MPRPPDNLACAVCRDALTHCDAADFGAPGKTHLQFMYDLRVARHSDDDMSFIVYAINRMLAPFRDNLRKKNGESASRTVRSRNVKAAENIASRCLAPGPRGLKCIRTAHHEGDHRF